ncbi:hypothetical protein COO91_01740 [Nostoc flagelliforme CCNUN1]|uniref:Uncharacterized protein n=1 Tax=Nostoc flagelliforme CCNUN1 TaxID=2038116 RepID=A0A2K8SKA8_9NOSO|nr:hypothetical protein COO91_01740 [Nostoc flagelliforme CCNUN1]
MEAACKTAFLTDAGNLFDCLFEGVFAEALITSLFVSSDNFAVAPVAPLINVKPLATDKIPVKIKTVKIRP